MTKKKTKGFLQRLIDKTQGKKISKFLSNLRDFFSNLAQYIKLIFTKFNKDFGAQRATSLAYSTFLSMVPIVLLALSILTSLRVFDSVETQIEEFISNNFIPTQADTVMEYLHTFSENLSLTNSISVVTFLFAGIFLLISMEKHLNAIWKVETSRKLFHAIVSYWAVLTMGPILLGVSIYITQQFQTTALVNSHNATQFKLMSSLISFAITTTLFFIMHFLIPNIKVKFKAALAGGLFTALIYEVVKLFFRSFASSLPHNKIYGSIAVVFLFLLWIFGIWAIFLIGAEIAYIIQFPPVKKDVVVSRKNLFSRELSIFLFIIKSYLDRHELINLNLIQEYFQQYRFDEIDYALDSLLEHKLIMDTDDRGYIPYHEPVKQNLGIIITRILGINDEDKARFNPNELKKTHPEIYQVIERLRKIIDKNFKDNLIDVVENKNSK